MTEFKVGDRVQCIESDEEIIVGSIGTVCHIKSEGTSIGVHWDKPVSLITRSSYTGHSCDGKCVDLYGRYLSAKCLALYDDKGKKPKQIKPSFVRYLAHGFGCRNTSELFQTEEELKEYLKKVAYSSSWTGDIVGYKLVPLYKVEKDIKMLPVIEPRQAKKKKR